MPTKKKSTPNAPRQRKTNPQKSTDITPEQVAGFLRQHPDWLFENDELMERLNLRSEFHGAASLLEHQTQVLRRTNEAFKQKFSELNTNASKNQDLIESLLLFCVKLLEAGTLTDVYNVLQHALPDLFDVDFVQLILRQQTASGNFRVVDDKQGNGAEPGRTLLDLTEPKCLQIGKEECQFLFGLKDGRVRSAALIPLLLENRAHAVCCLGSENPARYHPDKDVTILSYIRKLASSAVARIAAG